VEIQSKNTLLKRIKVPSLYNLVAGVKVPVREAFSNKFYLSFIFGCRAGYKKYTTWSKYFNVTIVAVPVRGHPFYSYV
jgi:hypothetical protein